MPAGPVLHEIGAFLIYTFEHDCQGLSLVLIFQILNSL